MNEQNVNSESIQAGDVSNYNANVQSHNNDNQKEYQYYQAQGNPYSQGDAYGQGIYTGDDFVTKTVNDNKKKDKKPSNGTGKRVVKFVASAVAFGLIAGCVMVGVNTVGNKILGNENITKKTEVATVATTDSSSKDVSNSNVADVAEAVMPSIVSITNTSVQEVRLWFQSYEQEVSGSGSGIIIGQTKDEILIATNYHVIQDAKELTVAFCDESAVETTIKGYDETADLAVISVKVKDMDASTLDKIKVAALGTSDDLRVGESAIAIGNALGYGQSVTVGYISAINREVEMEDKTMTLLQTDAAINPGNSGGALLNERGEVIGINTVKFVDSTVEGMGYAIPISTAIPIINDLMNQEVVEESEQGYLGIQGNDITDEYASGFGMPKGVYVVKIVEGSPADKCGLKAGDIITKFAGRDVTGMNGLQNILSSKTAGQEVEMVVQRNNEKGEYEEVTISVILGAKKDMPAEATEEVEEQEDIKEERDGSVPEEYYQEIPDEFFDFFNQDPFQY